MNITDDTNESIRRYTDAYVAAVEGGMTPALREECRSYACEAMQGLLRANPEFDLVRRLEELARRQGR